jgi:hypothetical protein
MVAVHEGGYSELYVPFCGLAVIEQLARTRSKVGAVVCIYDLTLATLVHLGASVMQYSCGRCGASKSGVVHLVPPFATAGVSTLA